MSICSKCGVSYEVETVHFCAGRAGVETPFKCEPQVGVAARRPTGMDAEILAELKEIRRLIEHLLESSGINLDEVNDG